jgi:preprotein translocase subunit YajC
MVDYLRIGIAVVVVGVSGYLLWKRQRQKEKELKEEIEADPKEVVAEVVPEDPNKKVE